MLPFDEIARANPDYVDGLYREYLRDPASVDERWALVFAGFDLALRDGARPGGSVAELVHAYRELGHLVADLDPLGGSPREHPLLRLSELGFSERDLDRVVDWAPFKGGPRGPLRELIAALRETYCGPLGVEYLSVADKARREWLQARMEPRRNHPELGADERRAMLERLVTAEMFEQFLQARYPGQKRFSLEGGEALVPLLDALVEETARRVAPVLLHGDAAFMGQGIVYETLALSPLPGFTTGGTIHVIVNNQIGFTTSPEEYLFTRYPSDPAQVLRAPVFHVNGDDPEAAVQAARLAAGYRQTFRADVFIDFVCYRRHGHNELDDPTPTQPVMYEQIRNHPSVVELYTKRLVQAGVVDETQLAEMRKARRAALEGALATARQTMPRQQVFAFGGVWRGLGWAGDDWSADTRAPAAELRAIGEALAQRPEDFTPNPRVKKLLEDRRERVARGEALDWGTAELLAYGSLLLEGTPVRVSGQDTVRGTFGHRHAAIFDAKDGRPWVPLNHVRDGQALLEAVNSPLSEEAVLGFEYGMSSGDPRRLMIWEAQFGDFVNSAQVIIDQFIASGESKWQRMSGLVLLLPHGYEGQGSEHSSARLERFLQLCADRNMQVIVPTTPAQIFHALRRQIHRRFRKPLVVMSPKSLLRHPQAVSSLAELTDGGFRTTLDDPRPPSATRRLVVCSGKIFYALDAARREKQRDDVALVRVEQLYPFPVDEVRALLERHASASEVCWVQEEPANQGAWWFMRPLLSPLLRPDVRFSYIGRVEAAGVATGSHTIHAAEEQAILEQALEG